MKKLCVFMINSRCVNVKRGILGKDTSGGDHDESDGSDELHCKRRDDTGWW